LGWSEFVVEPTVGFPRWNELHKRLHGFVARHADGMHVSFDEAGTTSCPSIDHSRPITHQLSDFSIRANGNKPAFADGGSFDNRGSRIDRHDFTVQDDQIGGPLSPSHDLAD